MSSSVEVILIDRVDRLGRFGDRANVKLGYAVNYLIPQGKALLTDNAGMDEFNSIKKDESKRRENLLKDASQYKDVLNEKTIKLTFKTHDAGKLYGSVNADRFVQEVKSEFDIELDKKYVRLQQVKEVGSYPVEVEIVDKDIFKMTLEVVSESSGNADSDDDFLVQPVNPAKTKKTTSLASEAETTQETNESDV